MNPIHLDVKEAERVRDALEACRHLLEAFELAGMQPAMFGEDYVKVTIDRALSRLYASGVERKSPAERVTA